MSVNIKIYKIYRFILDILDSKPENRWGSKGKWCPRWFGHHGHILDTIMDSKIVR